MPRLSPRRRPAAAVVTVALLAVLTACGGSDNTTPTAAPSSSTAAPTAAPTDPPTTTTTAPSTTATPTTVPVVTDAPTTTLDPAAVEAQIREDFEATVQARMECGVDPSTCDLAAIAVRGSEEYKGLSTLMEERLAKSLRSRQNSGPFSVTIEEVQIESHSKAVVTACITDGLVLFDTRATSDPSDDVVFDDSVVSARSTWRMAFRESWLRVSGELIATYPGSESCGSQ